MARFRQIIGRYLVFPLASLLLLIAVVALAAAVFHLELGKIDVGRHQTVTLHGRLKMIELRYTRPSGLPVVDELGRPIPERVAESASTKNLPPPRLWIRWPRLVCFHSVSAWNQSWLAGPGPLPDDEAAVLARQSLRTRMDYYTVGAPTWLLVPVTAVIPVWYFAGRCRKYRARRYRQKRGLCLACGYDLRGTPERCPECGRGSTGVAVSVSGMEDQPHVQP